MLNNRDLLNSDYILRPIHYLGSKLRLLPDIMETIDELNPGKGTVCDLFAGSGTVSRYLSSSRRVISIDVQEYSGVLGQALLFYPDLKIDPKVLVSGCFESENSKRLKACFSDLLLYEQDAMQLAKESTFEQLADLVDYGSFLDYEKTGMCKGNADLNSVLEKSVKNLKSERFNVLPNALVTRYFGGIYFSFQQAIDIDCLLECVNRYEGNTKRVLLAALLSTASDCVNTVGKQFAQPLQVYNKNGKIKSQLMTKILKDRAASIQDTYTKWLGEYNSLKRSPFGHEVLKLDFLNNTEFLNTYGVDLVYADPPYTRSHYSRYYHVLETMCLRDNPEVSLTDRGDRTRLSRGKYRVDRYQSDFCIASKAEGAFDTLFKSVAKQNVPLVLSYSPFDPSQAVSPRLQTIDQLIDLAKNYYNNVSLRDINRFNHSKLNSSENLLQTSEFSEVLICCRNEG